MCPPVEELHSLAKSLVAMFMQGHGASCMDEAIVLDRKALELCAPGHPERSHSLTRLAIHLRDRYNRLGAMMDLEEAIVLDREALELRPPGHPDRLISLNNLEVDLSTRYEQLGNMEDINVAIVLGRDAVALRPPGHPDQPTSLNNLAADLTTRYKKLGEVEDLNEAIVLLQHALALCPPGHPDRSTSLDNLALCLYTRYHRLGTIEDLDEAIVLNQEALALHPSLHPDQSNSLNTLALCLGARYEQLGEIEDLNKAIVFDQDVLTLCPPGHPGRPVPLTNLAVHLSTRYMQLGAIEDLDKAIVLCRDVLGLCPPGHPTRSSSLNNLTVYLCTRYDRLGVKEDLDEAIVLGRDALALHPLGHPDRSKSLNNLAIDLYIRHKRHGMMEDLSEAIALDRDALALYPPGHPSQPASLNNLAYHLSTRYKQSGEMDDLGEVIDLSRAALALCPSGHPHYMRSLTDLAGYLRVRFTQSSQLKDKEELFDLYARLEHVSQVASFTDLSAVRTWIKEAEDFQHPTLLPAYETSLRLLIHHLATLPSLPQHHTVLKGLTSSLAVDAFSACLRQQFPIHAVELLEQGRGVFWSQLTRLRSPLEDVIRCGPEGTTLAVKFRQLTSLIRNSLDSPDADQHDLVCRLNVELQRVITSIRELPGLSRFLLPALFSDLRQAACEGPVIIVNASKYSCDALVVFVDQDPVHIPLPITVESVRELSSRLGTLTANAKSINVARSLGVILRDLWDKVVSPIIEFLRMMCPSQSRIWWCPTAEFSLLPLHAAGPFRAGQQNLSDLYISSYTPTLTALIRARLRNPSHSVPRPERFVAIGQAEAIGESKLVSISAELMNIGRRVDGPAIFTHIEGQESCIARVTEELGRNEWVHIACHGIPNPKHPFKSAFALHDGHFTIQQIIQCNLENPQFAYLSACHTTVGDEESPDELVHLASAMQFVGFRSVIGTMWAVDDDETNKITSTFYENMIDESGRLDHTRAAFALNKTMKKSADVPFDQRILYVHLGA